MEARKKCTDCGQRKPLNEFYGRGANRKGPSARCKVCQNVYTSRWAHEHPEKSALHWRKSQLRRYNLTIADYDRLLAAQGGCCAICRATVPGGKGQNFRIDHDHSCCPERMKSCGKCVRGLLCNYCNLHLAGEEPRRLRDAADYLEDFKRRCAAAMRDVA